MDVVRRYGVTVSFASDGLSRALQFAREFQLRYFFAHYINNQNEKTINCLFIIASNNASAIDYNNCR